MSRLQKTNNDEETAKTSALRRVVGWLEEMLPDDEKDEEDGGTALPGKDTTISVNQLSCTEPGCPEFEVVMILRRAKPREKLMFKIYKKAADISHDEVVAALRKAEAEERGEVVANDHNHAEVENDHDHTSGGGHEGGC